MAPSSWRRPRPQSLEGSLFYAQSWLLVHYLRSLPDAGLGRIAGLRGAR